MEQAEIDNRFTFHPADEEKARRHQAIRENLRIVANALNYALPEGREKSLAITKLEEAMMWANASIARN